MCFLYIIQFEVSQKAWSNIFINSEFNGKYKVLSEV